MRSDALKKLEPKIATPRVKGTTDSGEEIMTPAGIMTSEFWLTVAGIVAVLVLVLTDEIAGDVGATMIGGATGLYAVGRGIAKR